MATDNVVVLLLIMADGILAPAGSIFAGSLLFAYPRRTGSVNKIIAGGGKTLCDSARNIR